VYAAALVVTGGIRPADLATLRAVWRSAQAHPPRMR